MEAQTARKRKRSAIACTRCHDRKVRCSVALQGIPCVNCAQDGTECKVYGQPGVAQRGQPLRPREAVRKSTGSYSLTPSPGSVHPAEVAHNGPDALVASQERVLHVDSISNAASPDEPRRPVASAEIIDAHPQIPAVAAENRRDRSRGIEPPKDILVPYYSGEAGGLEFLSDICSPHRQVKGPSYVIGRNVLKRERFKPDLSTGSRPSFPSSVCIQLIRCFFNFVYPFLPVVNAGEFISHYAEDPNKISGLLLWSVFFASSNYLDGEGIKATGFKTRKVLKEFCYQNAKVPLSPDSVKGQSVDNSQGIYDAQQETDKTTIISSTLLLAYWYVDLEDLDGSWYWIAIASHLCHGIGLHREPNYDRMPRCPFPPSQQSLWRRLWWCCYYRDAWLALGYGRPMRVHIDDCDVHLPTISDFSNDISDLPEELRNVFRLPDVEALAGLWIKLLQLSIKLEDALLLHYRPRRPPPSLCQMELDNTDILQLLNGLPQETEHRSRTYTLHVKHLRCYCHAVVIVLYRPYMLSTPGDLSATEKCNLQTTAVQRAKAAAAGITSSLNKLIALDMIDTSPTMMVTVMMSAMQIHFFEVGRSEGLTRQHAGHNLNLHMIILAHLKKTYWTADMYHNLFTECLKALNSHKSGEPKQDATAEGVHHDATLPSSPSRSREDHLYGLSSALDAPGIGANSLEEFLDSFNPWENLPCFYDESPPVDWSAAETLI